MQIKREIAKKFSLGQFEAGDILLKENSDLMPESYRYECAGDRHFYRREFQSAVNCYEKSILIDPERPVSRYQYLVGIQEEKESKFVEAFKRYQMAIDADPEFIDPYVELGGLLVKVGDLKGALQCYRDAVRLDGSAPSNLYNLKAILEKMAKTEPDQYGDELAIVVKEYERSVLNKPITPLSDRKW